MKSVDEIKSFLTENLDLLKQTGIDQGEILYWETSLDTVRTFLDRISHNGATHDAEIQASVVRGNKPGQALTGDLSREGVSRLIKQVTGQASLATPVQSFPVLPGPCQEFKLNKKIFDPFTLVLPSDIKIGLIENITGIANKNGLHCSAKLMTGGGKLGVINTSGTLLVTEFSEASLSLILTGNHSISAYGYGASQNFDALDSGGIIDEAVRNANLQKLPPADLSRFGESELYFDLILEPAAAAEWIEMVAGISFNGLHYEEGESFISGKLNQKLLGENITLVDDGTDPEVLAAPFDFEGVPKQKLSLVELGVVKGVCYDTFLGAKYGKKATGHASPPFERSYGALPRHLLMKGGTSTLQEMIASCEEPTLYVTRFHYTNVVNAREGILTGMTKDGTFLIQNGKVSGPVSNLRFLESVPKALSRVTHLGRPKLVHDPVGYGGLYPEGTVVPPMKIEKVRFIGTSQNLK